MVQTPEGRSWSQLIIKVGRFGEPSLSDWIVMVVVFDYRCLAAYFGYVVIFTTFLNCSSYQKWGAFL